MVTAGVYMIGRNAVLFGHRAADADDRGASSASRPRLMAGTIGLVQNDIKRVLAYSTVSQLGYMFLAMGVGAYAAGIFHLFTHAFFKALLFLGSGAVIHALAGEQDLRRMGGLKKELPITYWTFLVGAVAIAGVPALAGFFSKDEILFRTFAGGHTAAVGGRAAHVAADRGLHVPARVPRLSWRAAASAPSRGGFGGRILQRRPFRTCARALPLLTAHRSHARQRAPSARRAARHGACAHRAGHRVGRSPATSGCRTRSADRIASNSSSSRASREAGDERCRRWTSACRRQREQATAGASEELELGLMARVVGRRGRRDRHRHVLLPQEASARRTRSPPGSPGLHRLLANKYYVGRDLRCAPVVRPIRIVSEEGLWKRGRRARHRRIGKRRRAASRRQAARLLRLHPDRLGARLRRVGIRWSGRDPGLLPLAVI